MAEKVRLISQTNRATVVPMLARPGEVNPANYKEFISGGFLLTWQLPPSPSSAGKFAIGIKAAFSSAPDSAPPESEVL